MPRFVLAMVALLVSLGPLMAQEDDARAKRLFDQLRCVVCQNQSIASSEAGVAQDLRQLVREQIDDGKSDPEIMDYLVERYGEFVLLKPRFSAHTLILWLSPVLIGLFGIFLVVRMRVERPNAAAPLHPDEEARLARLLDENSRPGR